MTDRIEAALDALGKATPGPWCPHYIHDLLRIGRKSLDITTDCDCLYEPDENDATLIARSPDLAAEVIRLREELSRLNIVYEMQRARSMRLEKWQSEAVKWLPIASAGNG